MADFEPIKKQSLSDAVFERIRTQIVGGDVAVGEVLPAERVLAEKLGVNRQAVREGLKRLEQAGLVSVRQGGGTRVLDFRRTGGLELLAAMIVTPSGIHTGVVRSVLEMRAALGPQIARGCAQRGGEAVAVALDGHVAAMRTAADLASVQEEALWFWGRVVAGTHNVAYQLAYNALDQTYRQVMPQLARLLEPELRATDHYAALAAAVRQADPDGAAAAAETIVGLGTQAVHGLLDALDEGG